MLAQGLVGGLAQRRRQRVDHHLQLVHGDHQRGLPEAVRVRVVRHDAAQRHALRREALPDVRDVHDALLPLGGPREAASNIPEEGIFLQSISKGSTL